VPSVACLDFLTFGDVFSVSSVCVNTFCQLQQTLMSRRWHLLSDGQSESQSDSVHVESFVRLLQLEDRYLYECSHCKMLYYTFITCYVCNCVMCERCELPFPEHCSQFKSGIQCVCDAPSY
jgi:hypothetical protein